MKIHVISNKWCTAELDLLSKISLDLYLGILVPINMLITIYKKLAYV